MSAGWTPRLVLTPGDRLTAEIAGKEKSRARIEASARVRSDEKQRLSPKLANAREASHYVSLARFASLCARIRPRLEGVRPSSR